VLQEQQLETAEVPFKLSWLLCNIPYCKSVHNTSIQNEIFIEMTALEGMHLSV